MTVYSDTIAETLSVQPANATIQLRYGSVAELLRVSGLMDGIRVQSGEIDETWGLAEGVSALIGVVLAERLALSLSQTVNNIFSLSIAEQAAFYDQVVKAVPASISESLAVAASGVVQLAVSVMETLGLEAVVAPAIMYHLSITERILVSDALARFLGAEVIESLAITPAMDARALMAANVAETLSIADELTPQFILRVTCSESFDLAADDAIQMIFDAEISEAIEIAGAYLAPNGSVTTWTMNTRSGAVTEYQNYVFNSFARVGNKYIGASDDGLYELLGDDDDGDAIIATIRTGFAQWAGGHLGSIKAAYIAVRGGGQYVLRIITADGKTTNYTVTAADGRTTRVQVGKGLRSRYFAFELVTAGQDFDLDTLEFIPLVADRRV